MRPAEIDELYPILYEPLLRRSLEEDLGMAGDLTSDAVIPAGARAHARLVNRKQGRIAGLPVALATFRLLCPTVAIDAPQRDGDDVDPGTTLASIDGPARPLLTAERTALNLLCRLSGIATATREAVALTEGTRTRVCCTRKTTPGLRALEKYAVRVGGGVNHRFGLDDGILIKDNHIVAAGGIAAAVGRARARIGHMVKIEVEVDTLEQLQEAIAERVDAVLLDNMGPDTLARAIAMVDGRLITEASGGITPANLAAVAQSGVDIVSLGWLTHSAPILDIGLDLDPL